MFGVELLSGLSSRFGQVGKGSKANKPRQELYGRSCALALGIEGASPLRGTK